MKTVEVTDLTRVYISEKGYVFRKKEKILAVDHISFDVHKGELFGFVGPNGAGKTTTVKMLCTLLIPTSGTARVLGYDVVQEVDEIRPRINVIFGGERGLYWRLSGRDNLKYFAILYGVEPAILKDRVDGLLDMVGLLDRADEKVENYSRGMKQRLHIAKGLVNDPEVIFMDEPTQGLDPEAAHDLRKIISDLTKGGKTIFLTTHYMLEADELCNRVAVINHGRIAAIGSPKALKDHVKGQTVIEVEFYGSGEVFADEIRKMASVSLVTTENVEQKQIIKIQTPKGGSIVPMITERMRDARIIDVRIREPTLEDAYLKLVGAA